MPIRSQVGSELKLLKEIVGGNYTIKRELGSGSMTTVYLAEDEKHNRPVAIKLLQPEFTASLEKEQFLREIRIAASLNHPNILPVYDSEVHGGIYYYVMPYVAGQSLRDRLSRQKRLSIEESFHIVRDLVDALTFAHKQGVIHRDIKPENILLMEGHAVLTDFGIARAMTAAGRDNTSQRGWILGTPAYMSPEQASSSQEIDDRSDIYSLGCVVFEMLTGKPPFTGSSVPVIIMNMFTQDVPSIRTLRPEVPMVAAMAIRKALAKSPDDRFGTISEFVQALESDDITQFHATEESIAVLPFTNLSQEQDTEYLADGLTEEIINALSKVEHLSMVSRTSVYAIRGKNLDVRALGEQLNVLSVLEGTVRKSGNKLRIHAQLIDVANGYQLWSERFNREMEEVFAIQEEIAQNIVRALRVILSKSEEAALVRTSSVDVKAYEYYLRGRQFFHQTRKKSLDFARQMFIRATEIDPGYALAYAGIADSCSLLNTYYPGNAADLAQADEASSRALKLDPEL
ncbi:MAG TPA: serine/threonine-protein kinase, partial [bacterium]|nr:serine/threonine-protein kinase [bacterium]